MCHVILSLFHYVSCQPIIVIGRTRGAKQAKRKPSVSMDTTTTTEDATPADDVITRDLTPER